MAKAPILQEENPLLDDAVMQPLVVIFLQRLPETIQNMDHAQQGCDWTALARYAHQIKGTAGSFGYPDLTDQAAALEKCLKAGDIESAADLFANIKKYVLGEDEAP